MAKYKQINKLYPVDIKLKVRYPFTYLYWIKVELFDDKEKLKAGKNLIKIVKNTRGE